MYMWIKSWKLLQYTDDGWFLYNLKLIMCLIRALRNTYLYKEQRKLKFSSWLRADYLCPIYAILDGWFVTIYRLCLMFCFKLYKMSSCRLSCMDRFCYFVLSVSFVLNHFTLSSCNSSWYFWVLMCTSIRK